jgi:hypothetical protein
MSDQFRHYDVGSLVTLTAQFKVADVLTNPTSVTFFLKLPDNTITTYRYGTDSELAQTSTGIYTVEWPITQAGRHQYAFIGTGDAQAVRYSEFQVRIPPF